MRIIVQHPFTFPHGQTIRIILSDQYEDNYISPSLAKRLFVHLEARSSYFYIDDHFIVQFEVGEFIDDAKCCLDKRLLEDHPMILGKVWLNKRIANFYKISNILWICNGRICINSKSNLLIWDHFFQTCHIWKEQRGCKKTFI